jgi:UDP-3-O-[3-hydroxymyristoyl] glucosamine N-acyltransferase
VPFTVADIAGWVGGTASGPADTPVSRATSLADAGPGDLTLVDGAKRRAEWEASRAAAAVVPVNFPDDPRPLVRVADPLAAFIQIVLTLRGDRPADAGIHPTAVIHPTAQIGANPFVGPHAVVGERTVIGANARIHAGAVVGRFCTVGDDVTLYPRVTLYDDVHLGSRVVLHAGTVVGADGFGYKQVRGRHEKVPQLGGVVIDDDVEVGANTTIDAGTFGPTRVGAGTKIDNQVMIAHNCRVGRHNLIVSQTGLAGSCSTGDYVVLAGQVGVADHTHIGHQAVIAAKSGVLGDVPAGTTMVGYPAMPGREYMRCAAEWRRIPGLRRDLAAVKKHLGLAADEDDS